MNVPWQYPVKMFCGIFLKECSMGLICSDVLWDGSVGIFLGMGL